MAQQVPIGRIEQMPNMPTPYVMRDWKRVAMGYDSLVFDLNRTGQYLPLCSLVSNTVNYPNHGSFGLHTVVGTTSPSSAEAINCLPAVIGASLAGIDKSNQNGYNWVLMCEEWFNRRPQENIYLNHPSESSGDDWWYETMPNVFFYQLSSLYPGTGDFDNQFRIVADRWAQSIEAMGGSTRPWQLPNVDHRAWSLSTMSPNNTSVHEPEAAGAIAWLLYNAYVKTGNPRYRIDAELAMDALNNWPTNPSYELQLPYGTLIAARMNAELGTTYDVQKMLNWCFSDGYLTLRSWGVVVGNWGGYDCSGLIGEVHTGVPDQDYAFIMNVFEQVGALVPLVRYDDRFARAIGKWVLNAANAARLFYTNYLPDQNQDSEEWSHLYDPQSYIAHEAMRQKQLVAPGASPYATGDAISGRWGLTNLALYGSSHVGIFGGIIDTTNVPMILRLDVLKTDYFHSAAYPTYLYFNPYGTSQSVELDVGNGQHDIYDGVSKTFLSRGVSGKTMVSIPADGAVLAVVAPAGGVITFDLDKTLVNGVVVDYRSGRVISNHPPRIKALAADTVVTIRDSTTVFCTATDADSDAISYSWSASGGTISGGGSIVKWTAPDIPGLLWILCRVSDGRGGQTVDSLAVRVVAAINHLPNILQLSARPGKIDLLKSTTLTCTATDPDQDTLSYSWNSGSGSISGEGPSVMWNAPANEGNYTILCRVNDGRGGIVEDSIGIVVRDFSKAQTGDLIAYYPFSGNANDSSGFGHNGVVHGTQLVSDRFGRPGSAYYFDGSGYIQVTNDAALNFQQAISVNFWMKVSAFFGREQYPLSHGSWENRWKISITPERRLRWTVKTSSGIKDLDSRTFLATDSLYNITALYSGLDFELYINGNLDAFSSWSGSILTTSIDLTIGQVLPTVKDYNFKGVLDDIRIYDYALSVPAITSLYDVATSVQDPGHERIPAEFSLLQNYPNPFNPATNIRFQVPRQALITLKVFDVLGREAATLVDDLKTPGTYSVTWNAANCASGAYYCRLQTPSGYQVRQMLLIR